MDCDWTCVLDLLTRFLALVLDAVPELLFEILHNPGSWWYFWYGSSFAAILIALAYITRLLCETPLPRRRWRLPRLRDFLYWLGVPILRGYPFLLWLGHVFPRGEKNKFIRADRGVFCRNPDKYRLYLYPDQLLGWFLLFAVAIGTTSLTIGPMWGFVILVGYWIGFGAIYKLLRLPCLREIIPALPKRLEEWLIGHVERIDLDKDDIKSLKTSQFPADIRLRTMVHKEGTSQSGRLRIPKSKRCIARMFTYHPQEWLLRAAIARFFQEPSPYSPSGTLKIFFYWGAPVWIGYFLLLVPLLFPLQDTIVQVRGLVITLLVWAMLSTLFSYYQMRVIAQAIAGNPLPRSDLDSLPLFIQACLASKTASTEFGYDIKQFESTFVRAVSVIYTAAFGIYLLIIGIAQSSGSGWF